MTHDPHASWSRPRKIRYLKALIKQWNDGWAMIWDGWKELDDTEKMIRGRHANDLQDLPYHIKRVAASLGMTVNDPKIVKWGYKDCACKEVQP